MKDAASDPNTEAEGLVAAERDGSVPDDGDGSPASSVDAPAHSRCSAGGAGLAECGSSDAQRQSSDNKKKRRVHPTAKVKGNWSAEEDERLIQLVKTEGEGQWSVIARHFPGRIGKQCRERWHNQLRPDIRRDAWTDAEEDILIEAHRKLGNKWADIAKVIQGRTENAVKNHWNATLRRRDTDQGEATRLKEYMKALNILPHKRKRKPDGSMRSPRPGQFVVNSPRPTSAKKSSSAMAPTASSGGGAGRVCGGSKRAHIQLTIDVGAPAADDALITSVSPSGVTTRRAAQLASVSDPDGRPTKSFKSLTQENTVRSLAMQDSALSNSSHFKAGPLLLPPAPNSRKLPGSYSPYGGVELGILASSPPRRPTLPRLQISDCHEDFQEVIGDRTPGSGQTPAWVKPEDDENLENALNALKFPAQPGKESGTSPAMFECMHGLSISPFQSNSLQNLFRSAGTRSVPRADAEHLSAMARAKWHGGSMQTAFHWGMEDMSSASAKPGGIPGVPSIPPSPFSPDAEAVVRTFMKSTPPQQRQPAFTAGEELLGSCLAAANNSAAACIGDANWQRFCRSAWSGRSPEAADANARAMPPQKPMQFSEEERAVISLRTLSGPRVPWSEDDELALTPCEGLRNSSFSMKLLQEIAQGCPPGKAEERLMPARPKKLARSSSNSSTSDAPTEARAAAAASEHEALTHAQINQMWQRIANNSPEGPPVEPHSPVTSDNSANLSYQTASRRTHPNNARVHRGLARGRSGNNGGEGRRGASPLFSFQARPSAAQHHGCGVPSAQAAAAAKLHHHHQQQQQQHYHNHHHNHFGQPGQHQAHQYTVACNCAADCDLTDVFGDPVLGSPLVSLPLLSQYELNSIRHSGALWSK